MGRWPPRPEAGRSILAEEKICENEVGGSDIQPSMSRVYTPGGWAMCNCPQNPLVSTLGAFLTPETLSRGGRGAADDLDVRRAAGTNHQEVGELSHHLPVSTLGASLGSRGSMPVRRRRGGGCRRPRRREAGWQTTD